MIRSIVASPLIVLLAAVTAWTQDIPPATSDAPFAEVTLSRAQINAASPFFLVDGRAAVLLAEPPAKLEDLQVLRLWPGEVPHAQGDDPAVDMPTLTVFLPKTGTATGSAIIVMPGGGYDHLSPREGIPAAQWLAKNGITAFILKSRVGPKYHHPAELTDAQRSLRYVRSQAKMWGLDAERVGIIGFSAGGHLASSLATHFDAGLADAADPIDRTSCRPDLHILLYPVVTLADGPHVHRGSRNSLLGNPASPDLVALLSNEQHVTSETPPAFVVHSSSDRAVPPGNSDAYVAKLIEHNVPFEYLRAPIGGHGFGIADSWTGQALPWLRARGF